MLVLTRKQDEVIRIGRDVEIRVVKLKSGRVQLGIVAPRDVHVVRGELEDRHERKAG